MEKNPSSSSTSSRTDRKTIERNRRNHMKSLFSNLNSLVPSREVGGSSSVSVSVSVSLPDQLDEATKYIKKLQVKLEKMKEKKQLLLIHHHHHHQLNYSAEGHNCCLGPKVSVHKSGSALQVNLIASRQYHNLHFKQVVRVLEEEGAEVVNANLSVVGDIAFHSFHSMLDEQLHISTDSIQTKILERLAT